MRVHPHLFVCARHHCIAYDSVGITKSAISYSIHRSEPALYKGQTQQKHLRISPSDLYGKVNLHHTAERNCRPSHRAVR
jgi:hypothetical protein